MAVSKSNQPEPSRSRGGAGVWAFGAVVLLVGIGVAAYVGFAAGGDEALPRLGTVPAVTLTSQHNTPVSLAELRGHVWVADLIFTACSGPCLRMTSQMHRVQKALTDVDAFRMVSVSVDPGRDTPERLMWYADQALADHDRWLFLTGDMDDIRFLATDGFKLVVDHEAGDEPGGILHSDRFVLIDGDGSIRGYYDGLDPASVDRLVEDARRLAEML